MSFEAVQKVSFQKVFKSLFFRKLNKSTIIIFLLFFLLYSSVLQLDSFRSYLNTRKDQVLFEFCEKHFSK